MDNILVTIKYKTASGNEICVEVTPPVKELIEQSDRQIRSQRRQDRRYLDYMDFIDELTDTAMNYPPQKNAADLVIEKESHERLHAAINALSKIQRKRLLLYFMDGMTYQKIADLEGVNQSAIGQSITRSLKKLKEILAD
jgi:RNA polymerase sigma factor, sigma-70 family